MIDFVLGPGFQSVIGIGYKHTVFPSLLIMARKVIEAPDDTQEPEGFWKDAALTINDEDADFQIVNPVVAVEWFLGNQSRLARQAHLNEKLTKEIANLEVQLEWKKRELASLERKLLPLVYNRIVRSASTRMMEAHIPIIAEEEGVIQAWQTLTDEIEELSREVERRKPARDIVQARMKALSTIEENIREFVSWEKLEKRVNSQRPL